MKTNEYRHCKDCDFANWDKPGGRCALDGIVSITFFGCVPVEIIGAATYKQMDPERQELIQKMVGIE